MNQNRLWKVLFVCIGNSCRSQMAEGFARAYGKDVIVAASAGTGPAYAVAPDTVRVMEEKNIDVRGHFPKSYQGMRQMGFDLVINMSGSRLADLNCPVRTWDIRDPIGCDLATYREVRDEIESLVMNLVIELRRAQAAGAP